MFDVANQDSLSDYIPLDRPHQSRYKSLGLNKEVDWGTANPPLTDDALVFDQVKSWPAGYLPLAHYYYIRVLQKDGELAWASPLWIRFVR
jgi:hypothetical protein